MIALTRKIGGTWKSAGSKTITLSKGKFTYTFKPKYKDNYWSAKVSYLGRTTSQTVYVTASATKSFKVN